MSFVLLTHVFAELLIRCRPPFHIPKCACSAFVFYFCYFWCLLLIETTATATNEIHLIDSLWLFVESEFSVLVLNQRICLFISSGFCGELLLIYCPYFSDQRHFIIHVQKCRQLTLTASLIFFLFLHFVRVKIIFALKFIWGLFIDRLFLVYVASQHQTIDCKWNCCINSSWK